jgi:HK97 family phage major capsid protein
MDIDTQTDLETKAGLPQEAVVTHAEMMRAFEEFKEANDQRIADIERRGADVLTDEKLARIDKTIDAQGRRLDEIALKNARPALGSGQARASVEHKAAFEAYVRSGESANLRSLESKALSVGSNPDGGFLVPPEIEAQIGERLVSISPIRFIAGMRTISSNVYKKPFMTAGPIVGWAGETDTRAQTASPTLDELSFPAMELYAMPAATATLLEDSAVNIDEWLAQEVEQVFAAQEGAAFIIGDGNNKPKGFLSYNIVANASWTWGNIGYLASGVSGAFPASNPSDVLVDLIYAVRAGYRQNGVFVMNRKTQSTIRKFKDTTGNYLWQPPAVAGGRATLMTFPVVEAEDMPDIAANSLSIAFGDFNRGYLVVDRAGISVLRDPYTAKPYVLFYTTKRVGGGVQDFDAIKLVKFSAS